ncbi:alpha/beta fold hydrolase [Paradevosia shaoguanensis]|uniref:Alpha/beta hydrolase n=1 Tax=Paradevosia shaoguanensis TaxID=1335043 RepID=A0AA41QKI3_9HYPH|nr:alpha/beta hydrolase [Paradevosia shaoguanensis]MCF1741732.1 alpha/beta hydrolase [Paradevosia shaoguanensis]MCI0126215.1 alpha/beta hydrolase [Paradevosia shaoguanensis]
MPAIDKTIATPYATIRIRETSGRGLPLLMIHGAGTSKDVFAKQINTALGEMYRIIAVDLPGHGESSNAVDPATYSFGGFAKVLSVVLDELSVNKAAVYGWSLGGHVGIELLATDPRVAGLMITGAPPVNRGPIGLLRGFQMHRDMLLASKDHFTDEDIARFLRLCFRESEIPASFAQTARRTDGHARTGVFKASMMGLDSDQKRVVERSPVPIAVIDGQYEPVARLSYVGNLAYRNLWSGKVHVIPDAGHAPFWEKPDHFNVMLHRFMGDMAARNRQRPHSPSNGASG